MPFTLIYSSMIKKNFQWNGLSMGKQSKSISKLAFLEEIRSIAQNGLTYTTDKYDRQRYMRLLELAGFEYSAMIGVPADQLIKQFKKEVGEHTTPKVGVNAAIFSPGGDILLALRADDNKWCLPGGWTELNESPKQAVEREVLEELSITVKVRNCIDVFSRMPGDFGQLHTTCHILFHCYFPDGEIVPRDEVVNFGYFPHNAADIDWHRDHFQMASKAYDWFTKQKNSI